MNRRTLGSSLRALRLASTAGYTEETRSKVADLITARGVTLQANLVLVNEAYSEGYWGPPFEGMETESVQFFRTKTETAAVETICALVGVS